MVILAFLYRKSLKTSNELKENLMDLNEKEEITDKKLLVKSLITLGLTDYRLLPPSAIPFRISDCCTCRGIFAVITYRRKFSRQSFS